MGEVRQIKLSRVEQGRTVWSEAGRDGAREGGTRWSRMEQSGAGWGRVS